MKKLSKIFIFAALIALIFSNVSQAQKIDVMIDRFYGGLADIIENNMEAEEPEQCDPDKCVKEVDDYYRGNRMTIEMIRSATERSITQADNIMEKYESMSDEELEALQSRARHKGGFRPGMSPGLTRYNEALGAFAMKYPNHAIKIVTMAMRFLPGLPTGEIKVDEEEGGGKE